MMKGKGLGSNRVLLAGPAVIFIVACMVLVSGYMQTGDWFKRSIDLRGGTLISVSTAEKPDIPALEAGLSQEFGSVVVRELRSYSGHGITVQVESGVDSESVLSFMRDAGVDTSQSSVETVGSSLGEAFWIQAQISIVMAFILMGIIVFLIFRALIPSMAVMASAISDIVVTLAMMQVFSVELSLASFGALLMLIGYSIDTDILLTTRVVRKKEGTVDERIRGAFKTGMTMTLTTLAVLSAILLTSTSAVLLSIASVLLFGLVVDIANTWLMNASLIRMYAVRRGL